MLCCATPSFPSLPYQAGGSGVLYTLLASPSLHHLTWTPCSANLGQHLPTDLGGLQPVIRPIWTNTAWHERQPSAQPTRTQGATSTPRLGASHAPVRLHLQTETPVLAVPDLTAPLPTLLLHKASKPLIKRGRARGGTVNKTNKTKPTP